MGLDLAKLKWRSAPDRGCSAVCETFRQEVRIAAEVIKYVRKHRQTGSRASEAGGQLFGRASEEAVDVVLASGPYKGDERGRFHYRSNPEAAQRAIEENAAAGLLYLGEWHTHAEDAPEPSPSDVDAMKRILLRSTLNLNYLLLLIVGRSGNEDGLALISFSTQRASRWTLRALQPNPKGV